MSGRSWWRVEIERWILRTGWRLITLLSELALFLIVTVVAACWSLIRAVFYPLAGRFTDRAIAVIEDAFLRHKEWSSFGLLPIRNGRQRMVVAAIVWIAGMAVVLIGWFVMMIFFTLHVPRLPSLVTLLFLFVLAGGGGALAAATGDRDQWGGIRLG